MKSETSRYATDCLRLPRNQKGEWRWLSHWASVQNCKISLESQYFLKKYADYHHGIWQFFRREFSIIHLNSTRWQPCCHRTGLNFWCSTRLLMPVRKCLRYSGKTVKGPSTYYVILFTVKRFRRVTFFLVNGVEHQKLNQTTAELSFGWVFGVLVFNSAFGGHSN